MNSESKAVWRDLESIQPNYLNENLDILSQNHPHILQVIENVVSQKQISVRKTNSGMIQAAENVEGERSVFYDSIQLQNEVDRIKNFVQNLTPTLQTKLYFILGLDLGFTLNSMSRFMSQSSLSAFVVIEPDERLAACTFAISNISAYLQSNRIDFAVGREYLSQLEMLYDRKNYFAVKDIKVITSSTANQPYYAEKWKKLQLTTSQLQTNGQARFQSEVEKAKGYYQSKPYSRIKTLLSLVQTEGLAVRFIQQRFVDECRKQGIQIIDYKPGFANEIGILRTMYREKPDCLFFINRSPGEYVSSSILDEIYIPRMVWCVDDPNSFIKELFHPHDIVFTWDASYSDDMKKKRAVNVDHFPYVADLDRVEAKVREEFISPVSYIGQVKAFNPNELGLDDQTAELVKKVGEEKAKHPEISYQKLIIKHQETFGLTVLDDEQEEVPRFVRYGIYIVANSLRRIQVLEAAMPFGLRIYGGKDWLEVLGEHPLRDCYCGIADPQTDVPDIFVSSKINLNIHSLQALTSLNQRDFNCPLVGGFLLTDWVDCADEFFIPNEEMIFYRDIEDLKQKIEFYFNHEEDRLAVIEKGRQRVLKEHIYASRVPKVIETLNQRIQEQLYEKG